MVRREENGCLWRKNMNINSSIVKKSNLTIIGLRSGVRPPGPLICFRIISAGNNKAIL